MKKWSIEWESRLMKERYPERAQRILPVIEEECDRMEHTASRLYDEIPDRHMMQRLEDRIYDRVAQEQLSAYTSDKDRMGVRREKKAEELYVDDDIFATDTGSGQQSGDADCLRELVSALLVQEIFVRRCRRRLEMIR